MVAQINTFVEQLAAGPFNDFIDKDAYQAYLYKAFSLMGETNNFVKPPKLIWAFILKGIKIYLLNSGKLLVYKLKCLRTILSEALDKRCHLWYTYCRGTCNDYPRNGSTSKWREAGDT